MEPERVWYNHDILCDIFEHFSLPDGIGSFEYDRKSLTSCARVCRAFLDPALDVIWRELDDINCLLSLFPAFDQDTRGNHRFNGEITAQDWNRFHKYSRRVRSLFYVCDVPLTALAELASRAGEQSPLPSLRTLKIFVHDAVDANLQYILTPTLRDVSIEDAEEGRLPDYPHHGKESIADVFLHNLFDKAPLLEELQIILRHFSFTGELLHDVARCNHMVLMTLHVAVTDHDALQAISTIETLVDLSIICHMPGNNTAVCSGFLDLRKLYVYGRVSDMKALLSCISPPQLLYLYLSNTTSLRDRHDHAEQYLSLMEVISSKHHALRDITFQGTSPAPSSVDQRLALELFRPLLRLHDLQNVSFELQHRCLDLSDKDLHDMGAAWPSLTSFSLAYPKNVGMPTLNGLIHLAGSCPDIATLELPALDVSSLISWDPRPAVSYSLHQLVFSCASGMAEQEGFRENLPRLVQALFASFPRLEKAGLQHIPGIGPYLTYIEQ